MRIIAVTKTHGPEAAVAAWQAGIDAVGENRIQEALDKMDQVAEPVEWHLIGHLQRNKVKHLDRFALFHALDSERLLQVLVQVNTSGESSKGGFTLEAVRGMLPVLAAATGLEVRGAMTMAPFEADLAVLRSTFARCRAARAELLAAGLPAGELSMGMSGDYEVAVEEGATMVRLGTILFGERTP